MTLISSPRVFSHQAIFNLALSGTSIVDATTEQQNWNHPKDKCPETTGVNRFRMNVW